MIKKILSIISYTLLFLSFSSNGNETPSCKLKDGNHTWCVIKTRIKENKEQVQKQCIECKYKQIWKDKNKY